MDMNFCLLKTVKKCEQVIDDGKDTQTQKRTSYILPQEAIRELSSDIHPGTVCQLELHPAIAYVEQLTLAFHFQDGDFRFEVEIEFVSFLQNLE
jgi:hypothetical protein